MSSIQIEEVMLIRAKEGGQHCTQKNAKERLREASPKPTAAGHYVAALITSPLRCEDSCVAPTVSELAAAEVGGFRTTLHCAPHK